MTESIMKIPIILIATILCRLSIIWIICEIIQFVTPYKVRLLMKGLSVQRRYGLRIQ